MAQPDFSIFLASDHEDPRLLTGEGFFARQGLESSGPVRLLSSQVVSAYKASAENAVTATRVHLCSRLCIFIRASYENILTKIAADGAPTNTHLKRSPGTWKQK